MAGIYVHVPFCKVKCHYCDFHFSTQLKNRAELINGICTELERRTDYLKDQQVKTIYFGGGTPSVLESDLLSATLQTISKNYKVDPDVEVTLECNPDDITKEKLYDFKVMGINRLSIGIQSFFDDTLNFMNRAHTAHQAKKSIQMAQEVGFTNLTIDLIYGVPGTDMERWKDELNHLIELDVPHLSAYCLTIEDNTVFGARHKKGELAAFPDHESIRQFEYLIDFAAEKGLEQYEISNFSKPNFISKHNSAYWLGETYLGVGPAAHSYNGHERQWNISNNPIYSQRIKKNEVFHEVESLATNDQFNEYILTRLRTKWGIDLKDLNKISPKMTQAILPILKEHLIAAELKQDKDVYTLTRSGKFIADAISANLFQ